jgi:transcriptional regulator with XRE-family HTH domain
MIRLTQELSREIKSLRVARGLKQSELAEALGMDIAHLQRLEQCKLAEIEEKELARIREHLTPSFSALVAARPGGPAAAEIREDLDQLAALSREIIHAASTWDEASRSRRSAR